MSRYPAAIIERISARSLALSVTESVVRQAKVGSGAKTSEISLAATSMKFATIGFGKASEKRPGKMLAMLPLRISKRSDHLESRTLLDWRIFLTRSATLAISSKASPLS